MKISITGDLGSGKSTIAKLLSKKLGFDYISTGAIFREIAKEYGVEVLDLNKHALTDTTIDDRVDGKLKEYNECTRDIIIDSRLAWHFVPNSHKFYFEVDSNIAANRVLGDKERQNEQAYHDLGSAYTALQERKKTENKRYLERYGIDCENIHNYDIVVNTSLADINTVCNVMMHIIELLKKKKHVAGYWLSPQMLYPTENIRTIAQPEALSLRKTIEEKGYNDDMVVKCVKVDGRYYIWDGHKRCSAAIYNNIPYVPVEIIAIDNEEIYKGHTALNFVVNNIEQRRYFDWEDAHQFTFISYPQK